MLGLCNFSMALPELTTESQEKGLCASQNQGRHLGCFWVAEVQVAMACGTVLAPGTALTAIDVCCVDTLQPQDHGLLAYLEASRLLYFPLVTICISSLCLYYY